MASTTQRGGCHTDLTSNTLSPPAQADLSNAERTIVGLTTTRFRDLWKGADSIPTIFLAFDTEYSVTPEGCKRNHPQRQTHISELGIAVGRKFNHSARNHKVHHVIIEKNLKAKPVEFGPALGGFGVSRKCDNHTMLGDFLTETLEGLRKKHKVFVILGHNIQVDLGILRAACGWSLPTYAQFNIIDTEHLAKGGLVCEKISGFSLDQVLAGLRLGLDSVKRHNAGNDAWLALRCAFEQGKIVDGKLTPAAVTPQSTSKMGSANIQGGFTQSTTASKATSSLVPNTEKSSNTAAASKPFQLKVATNTPASGEPTTANRQRDVLQPVITTRALELATSFEPTTNRQRDSSQPTVTRQPPSSLESTTANESTASSELLQPTISKPKQHSGSHRIAIWCGKCTNHLRKSVRCVLILFGKTKPARKQPYLEIETESHESGLEANPSKRPNANRTTAFFINQSDADILLTLSSREKDRMDRHEEYKKNKHHELARSREFAMEALHRRRQFALEAFQTLVQADEELTLAALEKEAKAHNMVQRALDADEKLEKEQHYHHLAALYSKLDAGPRLSVGCTENGVRQPQNGGNEGGRHGDNANKAEAMST